MNGVKRSLSPRSCRAIPSSCRGVKPNSPPLPPFPPSPPSPSPSATRYPILVGGGGRGRTKIRRRPSGRKCPRILSASGRLADARRVATSADAVIGPLHVNVSDDKLGFFWRGCVALMGLSRDGVGGYVQVGRLGGRVGFVTCLGVGFEF
jgi:hypothetical protein